MFRCVTEITFVQQGTGRNKTLSFDFVNSFTASDTWVDLTNQAEITLPKNIYARDENGKLFPLGGVNKNIGGFDNSQPLFLRGDKVTINFGYRYFKNGNEIIDIAPKPIFSGFISEVTSKKPIQLKCEDNMWLLKQLPAKPQVWKGSVEDLFANLLAGTQFKVNRLTQTNIGPFVIGNETVAQLLERLRKDAHLESYFRGDELRVGAKVYIDSEAIDHTFIFQQNIISDDLMYKRKDDVVLSAVCISKFEDFTGKKTKDGQNKTKKEQLEILIYWDKPTQKFKYTKKKKGESLPAAIEGERRTLNFINITSEQKLFDLGVEALQKYFYTGFKGKFLTFGIPYVKQGDNVIIKDKILPERDGKYKVKGVNYSGGTGGHRQEIILDYKIP